MANEMELLKRLRKEISDRKNVNDYEIAELKKRMATDKPRGNELSRTRCYGRRDILNEMEQVLTAIEADLWGTDSEPKSTPAIWTTKEGERIPVVEMSDSHVQNAHKMMAKKILELDRSLCCCSDDTPSSVSELCLDHLWGSIR